MLTQPQTLHEPYCFLYVYNNIGEKPTTMASVLKCPSPTQVPFFDDSGAQGRLTPNIGHRGLGLRI